MDLPLTTTQFVLVNTTHSHLFSYTQAGAMSWGNKTNQKQLDYACV